MLKTISLLFVCFLLSCWSVASQNEYQSRKQKLETNLQDNQETEKGNPQLSLRMERFSWTHTLIYKIEIQPEGKVIFTKTNGKFISTKTIGKAEVKLGKEKMEQLLTEIENSDFFSLDSAYGYSYKNCPSALSDSDSVKIYIKLNGKEKSIDHNLGCFDISSGELKKEVNRNNKIHPQQLYKLENKIDDIVETKRWIGENK
jgi:hypothetical protein